MRFAWGVLVMVCAIGVLEPLHAQAAAHRGAPWAVAVWMYVPFVGAVRLLGEYAAQSGVASIKLGMMRQLGYEIPERFRYPLFARSPADFWRRWNTYVGDWARSYVFFPLMLAFSRRPKAQNRRLPYAASIVVTLAAVGLLHDAYLVAADGFFRFPGTLWFAAIGVVVVAWEAVGSFFAEGRLRSWAEHAMFLVVASYAAAYLWW
jgi:D-alanyl-lipoteichoic acid acyltransferase DltB (MBOAT superfamily)